MSNKSCIQTPPSGEEEGLVYFKQFFGLADTTVLFFDAPIKFTACDFII